MVAIVSAASDSCDDVGHAFAAYQSGQQRKNGGCSLTLLRRGSVSLGHVPKIFQKCGWRKWCAAGVSRTHEKTFLEPFGSIKGTYRACFSGASYGYVVVGEKSGAIHTGTPS